MDAELKTVVSNLARQYGAERVYLFGSYARGDARGRRGSERDDRRPHLRDGERPYLLHDEREQSDAELHALRERDRDHRGRNDQGESLRRGAYRLRRVDGRLYDLGIRRTA